MAVLILELAFVFVSPSLPALDTFLLSGVSFEELRKGPHCVPSGAPAPRCSAANSPHLTISFYQL